MILVNDQIDAHFFLYVYFYSLRVSGSHVSIIRRVNCINVKPGLSLSLDDRLVCSICSCIQDGHMAA